MPGSDKRHMRVVVLIALFAVAGIALRGYLPGEEPAPEEQAADSPASLIAVVLVLATALAIITVAVIASLRDPRGPTPSGFGALRSGKGEKLRINWRRVLLALGVILVWLLFVVVLLRLVTPDLDDSDAGTDPGTSQTSNGAEVPAESTQPAPTDDGGDVFIYLVAATVVMLVLVVASSVAAYRRQRRARHGRLFLDEGDAPPPIADVPADPLALAAEVGLEHIADRSREPRAAIIACYAAMEQALADSPGVTPQDSDTPSEVLARAVGHHAIRAESATELVDLFAEARFSPHVMTEDHRAAAERALRLVLADLRSHV